MPLEAIRYTRGSLTILDQLQLPHAERWLTISSAEDAWRSIRTMQVRGAPAIAIVAALSVAVEVTSQEGAFSPTYTSGPRAAEAITSKLTYLVTSRPTAVNLSDAAGKLSAAVAAVARVEAASAADVHAAYVAAAEQMLAADVSDNQQIGAHGAKWILDRVDRAARARGEEPPRKICVLTHCNTGSLATAGYGTALGIVRSLHASGRLACVYYGETRPYNQGARLTGYELLHDGIPATLVTDSMAGALMAQRGPRRLEHVGKVAGEAGTQAGDEDATAPLVAVIVGADRVAANGDTANKIGTYSLAVLARYHGLAFVVAAPRTTIDLKTASGAAIEIEQRRQDEVTTLKGPVVVGRANGPDGETQVQVDLTETREVSIAPLATQAWNPAFDVTPADLVDAIATEIGVVEKDVGFFELGRLFDLNKEQLRRMGEKEEEKMPDPREGP